MPKTELFEENVVNGGTVDKSETVNFSFKFNEGVTKDQIEYVYPDCGACTTVSVTDEGVVGHVIAERAAVLQNDITPVNKVITVKLKDGRCELKADPETLRRTVNTDVRLEKLNVAFMIKK